jgi:soluble lytic murein transglycosylase-like protein
MKKFITLGILTIIIYSSFYVGTKFSGGNSSAESTPIKYDMIGYYIQDDRDFESEATALKTTYNSNMSSSKIKHLLIYMDGLAKEYDVNYNLIKSVITTESNWKYNARSSSNALGLMQVMRACATDYKTPHSEMYDPYVNVTVGIMYLSKLLKEFQDVESALVAYNEGPRHAKKYKDEYIYNSRYVKKVTKYMFNFEPTEDVASL